MYFPTISHNIIIDVPINSHKFPISHSFSHIISIFHRFTIDFPMIFPIVLGVSPWFPPKIPMAFAVHRVHRVHRVTASGFWCAAKEMVAICERSPHSARKVNIKASRKTGVQNLGENDMGSFLWEIVWTNCWEWHGNLWKFLRNCWEMIWEMGFQKTSAREGKFSMTMVDGNWWEMYVFFLTWTNRWFMAHWHGMTWEHLWIIYGKTELKW